MAVVANREFTIEETRRNELEIGNARYELQRAHERKDTRARGRMQRRLQRSGKNMTVLSHYQTAALLKARDQELRSAVTSIDLGISTVQVLIRTDDVVFPGPTTLSWKDIEEIDSNENVCYDIGDNVPTAIRGFSETLGRGYSLMPTDSAPIMIMAGFPMHRSNNIEPLDAALAMVKPVLPVHGHLLDTATGLGYTAVAASRRASHVTTIELCPVAQDMARMNPWSRDLFDNPSISQVMGDASEEIRRLADDSFSGVIHDPPTLSLAGDLYSGEFYRQVFRIMKQRGRMFHYLGDPNSATVSRVTRGVVKRLYNAGFKKVTSLPKAFGVVANK